MSNMIAFPDFDWIEAAEDVVVPEQAAIAVYANPKGDVVIRQAGHYGPDEDMWIVVAPGRAPAVAEAILRAAGLHRDQTGGEAAAPKDRTAADRQRRYRDRNRNGSDDRDVTGRDGALPLLLENSDCRDGAAVSVSVK